MIYPELRWLSLASRVGQSSAISRHSHRPRKSGSPRSMPTCKMTRLILFSYGKLCQATMSHWDGG